MGGRTRTPRLLLAVLVLLAACGVAQLPWAPDERIAAAAYRSNEPASVTLVTVVTNKGGYGGHTALLINGSQRVLYDPAGSWYQPSVPERADLVYGITPRVWDNYLRYHARKKYHVVLQTRRVSRAVADQAIANAIERGASQNGFCAVNTGHILAATEGFEGAPTGFSPVALMRWFGALPGVTEDRFYEWDEEQAVEPL